jgi:hypothetical protein
MSPPAANGAAPSSHDPTRVVVVVPRKEARLHEYLQRSLAALKNVEVVLDRRATTITPADERRRRASRNSERQILICSLVRCPPEPAERARPEPAVGPEDTGHPRTLLWPRLRLEHL